MNIRALIRQVATLDMRGRLRINVPLALRLGLWADERAAARRLGRILAARRERKA